MVPAHRLSLLLIPRRRRRQDQGFSLSEVLVAAAVSAVVIGTAGLALQSQLRSIQGSSALITGRDTNATGLALLRLEVMRSSRLLFRQGNSSNSNNLDAGNHQAALTTCQTLAGNTPFQPVFGINQNGTTVPSIYGLGIGSNGTSYALRRCGPAIGGNSTPVLSTVIDGIAPMPCGDGRSRCAPPSLDGNGQAVDLPAVLAGLDHTLGSDRTSPMRGARQPAFRFRTDADHRQLELIDPSGPDDSVDQSFTSTDPTGVSLRAPLYLSARVLSNEATPVSAPTTCVCTNCTFFGVPVPVINPCIDSTSGTGLIFILDGSFTMSACSPGGRLSELNPNGEIRKYWDPSLNAFESTARVCLSTRMEMVQLQMRQVLNTIPANTRILIVSFSGIGGTNSRSWPADNQLATIGSGNNRANAITFVNSLSAGDPETWGNNSNAWRPLAAAVGDITADAAFVVTDDLPDADDIGRPWSATVEPLAIDNLVEENNERSKKLSINTVSIHLDSSWMRTLSIKAYGTYLKI